MSNFLSSSLPSTAANLGHVTLSVYSIKDWPQVEPLWVKLADSSPYSSFYVSAEWTGSWLEIFGELLQPEILVFEEQGVAVAACLLVKSTERRGPFRTRRIYLNTGGEDPADRGTIEFNSLLCSPGYEQAIAKALGIHLHALEWDEFVVEGICPGLILSWLQSESFRNLLPLSIGRRCFHVDLNQLRQCDIPYENSLSPNTRHQLRRSLRLYSKWGPVRTEVAQDLARVKEFFDEMRQLHQSTWKARGEPGAFASGRRLAFHRTLIRRAFPRGGIQMLRVTAGNETVGVLYNFVQNGKVYFNQSGFNYSQDKRLKPGLVTHCCAIRYCLEQGFGDYDFLAGEARYKRSLAKDCRHLAWVVFARPSIKLALIAFLRTVKRGIKIPARKQTKRATPP
jgi:Acetyltransferase (GNAT) domain